MVTSVDVPFLVQDILYPETFEIYSDMYPVSQGLLLDVFVPIFLFLSSLLFGVSAGPIIQPL